MTEKVTVKKWIWKGLTFNKVINFPYSFRILRWNSLLLTGKLENNFFTVTVVPICLAVFLSLTRTPEWSKVKCVATTSFFVLVSTVKSPRAQSELNASPLNPKVVNDWRSGKSDNFEVWCLSARTLPMKTTTTIIIKNSTRFFKKENDNALELLNNEGEIIK